MSEAAQTLGLGRTLVYRLIVRGDLATVRVGRRRLVPVAALDAFVQRLQGDALDTGSQR